MTTVLADRPNRTVTVPEDAVSKDQARLEQSRTAHATLGAAATDIGLRLEYACADQVPPPPRLPGAPSAGRTDEVSDPVHAQVAQLDQALRRRGGPLHRCAILLGELDALAEAIDADHRLPADFAAATLRPSVRTGPVGVQLPALTRTARQIGGHLAALNDGIFDAWRQMWRAGQGMERAEPAPGVTYSAEVDGLSRLEVALLSYAAAASYAASIARSLSPYAPAAPVGMCTCPTTCCPDGCHDRLWSRGRRISERCKQRQRRDRQRRQESL